MPRALVCLLASMLPPMLAVQAHAHHPGPTNVTPRSSAGLEVAAGEFELRRPGLFWVGTLKLEHAFFERVAVGALIPVAHVHYFDGENVTGPADAEVAARGLLYANEHGTCAFGARFGVELPTGDDESGLGGGHVMLSPELAAHLRPIDGLVVHGVVRGHFTASAGHEHAATFGSVLAPHADHELHFGALGGYFWEPLYALTGVSIGLLPGEGSLGPVVLSSEIGAIVADRVQLSFDFEVPVAGPERLQWLGRLGVDYLF